MKHLKLRPREFIGQHANQLRKLLIDETLTDCTELALATIVSINPDVLLPTLVDNITTKLSDANILKITKDDYFTYLTPEGELYDKSVIPGNDENTLNAINMKRESKVYSFKEQQEELQLRREIEEKKRREGRIKEPQYTPKQLEMIKAQKDKEQQIRNNLTELNSVIKNCMLLIRSAANGNPDAFSLYFKDLLPVLLEASQSPLAAPYVTKQFINLQRTVFPKQDTLADLIAHATLRILKPQCDLDPAWEDEEITETVSRTIGWMFVNTSKVRQKENERPMPYYSAPAFCYVFPLLKMSLMSKFAKDDENIIINGLKVVSEHAKLRGEGTKGDKYHPKYLPRKQMFSLLVELISKFLFVFKVEIRYDNLLRM